MVNSAISSDPLSSPSPSPEPPSGPSKPPEIRREIPMSSEAPHGRGGDNDSELSELTEDEQDRRSQSKKRASVHQPSVSSVKPSSRKRAPAADDDDKEYETEEEQDTRRNDKGGDEDDAMQEDEDGADDDADDSAKSSGKETDRTKDLVKGRRVPNRPPRPRSKKRNSIVPAPMWGWATKNDEEDEVEEGEQPEEEEEEGEVGEDDNEREEPEPEEDTAPPSARMPPPPATNADDFLRQEIEKRQADINNSRETPKVPAKPSVESEDEDEMEEGEIEEGDESDNDEDVGVAAPRTAPLMAASSIMAGSTVVGSTLMDDGGSDEEEEEGEKEDEDKDSDDDEAKDKGKDEDMDIDEDDTPPAKSNKEAPVPTSTKPISKKKEIVDETPVKDGRRSRIIKPASAQEQSREPSPDAASAAEDDALEQDQEDETEIQPAHRAEALDTLAIIELKFALLRENVYVEKMDNLAWEEALVNDGTHPEMLHMQSELTKRRDTRMRLADARQEVETQAVQRKRAHDEMAIWSWWQFERDQLQTDMISETNRKRRRLERDRRTLERPPPTRRMPLPPPEIGMPTVPLLRKTIESATPTSAITNKRKRSKHSSQPGVNPLSNSPSYPELPRLGQLDIEHDLRFLQMHAQPNNAAGNTRRSVNIDYAPGGGRMIVPGGGTNAFGVINDGLMGLGGGMSIGLMQSVQVYNEGPSNMPPPMPTKSRDMTRPSSRQGYFGSGRRSPSPRMGGMPWAGGNGTWEEEDRIIAVQHEKERDRRERERDLQHQADAARYRDEKEREQLLIQQQQQQQQQQQHRHQPAVPPHVHHHPHVHPHHHHHRPHHHHVVHRHPPAQPSPRPPREYERQGEAINMAAGQMHSGSPPNAFEGHSRSASLSKSGPSGRPPLLQGSPPEERERAPVDRERVPVDRERAPMDRERIPMDRERAAMDRERAPMERERPPMDRERPPMAMPFAVPSSSKGPSDAPRPGSAWPRDVDMRPPIPSPGGMSGSPPGPSSRFPPMERPSGPPMDRAVVPPMDRAVLPSMDRALAPPMERTSGPPTPLERPVGPMDRPLGPPMERPSSSQRSRPASQQHSRQGSSGGILSPTRSRMPLPAERPRSPGGAHSRSPSSAGLGRSPSHASVGRSPYHPSTAPGSPHRPAGTMLPPSGGPPTGLSGPGAGLAGPPVGLSGPGAAGLAGPALPPLAGPGAPPPPASSRQVLPLSTSVSGLLSSDKMAVDKERLPPVSSIPNS